MRFLYNKFKIERHETPTPNDYLYYSRKVVKNSPREMAEYFSSRIQGRKALMLDLNGSGVLSKL